MRVSVRSIHYLESLLHRHAMMYGSTRLFMSTLNALEFGMTVDRYKCESFNIRQRIDRRRQREKTCAKWIIKRGIA